VRASLAHSLHGEAILLPQVSGMSEGLIPQRTPQHGTLWQGCGIILGVAGQIWLYAGVAKLDAAAGGLERILLPCRVEFCVFILPLASPDSPATPIWLAASLLYEGFKQFNCPA
jgi:hypothetical protein